MPATRNYLKAWRKFRHLTQEQVIDRLAVLEDDNLPKTGASLSRIENGKQPYAQPILEALADIYQCEPSDLLGRDPTKEGELIDLVAILNATQKEQAAAVIKALTQARA